MSKRVNPNPNNSLVTASNSSAIVQPLSTLPHDIITRILMCLDPRSIVACHLVCRDLHQIFENQSVWQNLLGKHFRFNQFPNDFDFAECYKTIFRNMGRRVYCHSSEVLFNGEEEVLVRSDGAHIIGNLIIFDFRAYSPEEDSDQRMNQMLADTAFRVYNFKTKKFLFSIKALVNDQNDQFDSTCSAITDDNKKIIFGCDSGKIMIYDLESTYCTTILYDKSISESDTLVGFCNSGDRLISIRVKNTENKTTGCNKAENNTIIDIWDLKTRILQNTFEKKGFRASCNPVIVDEKLILGAHEKGIISFDLEKKKDSTTSNIDVDKSPNSICFGLVVMGNKLIGATGDEKLKVWDLDSEACLGVLRNGVEIELNALTTSGNQLIYCDTNGLVNTLDFNVSDERVFREIIDLYRSGIKYAIEAHDRFSRMPQEAKNKIHSEFYKIVKHRFSNETEETIVQFYYGQPGQHALLEEKAKAIENYLANCIPQPDRQVR